MAAGTDEKTISATTGDGGAARAAAIAALAKWLRTGIFPSRAVPEGSALSLELVGGVLRNLSAIEFALSDFVAKKPGPLLRAALYTGVWQLLFSAGVPDYAAVNETVAAAKRLRVGSPAFVNAVLRNVVRNKAALTAKLARAPLHIRLSHPEPLARRWTVLFGEEAAEAICARFTVFDNMPGFLLSVQVTIQPAKNIAAIHAKRIAGRTTAESESARLPTLPSLIRYMSSKISETA